MLIEIYYEIKQKHLMTLFPFVYVAETVYNPHTRVNNRTLCRSEETSKHFLLHCPRYENQRLKMLNSLRIILTDTPV